MARVKIGFSGLSVSEQVERARLITGNMTGNANYTTPSPALALVITATDALETAYNQSRGRDKDKIVAMKLRRKELLFLINQEAAYVQEASGADEEKILSSGFDVRASRTPRPVVAGEVRNVRVSDGSNSGKIRVDWDAANDAVIYLIVVAQAPNYSETEPKGITTKTHKEIGNLNPGTKYQVTVYGLGREEVGPLSESVFIIVR